MNGNEKTPEKIFVTGWLRANNAYGAKIKKNFTAELSPKGNTIRTIKLNQNKKQHAILHKEQQSMSNIKLFQSKQIRSVWNEEEQQWYFYQ